MSDSPVDELRAAYLTIQAAQARLDADRDAIRKKILDAEPTWGPCHQCGHTWRSHNMRRRLGKPPRRCPKCLSHFWFDPEYVPRARVAGTESNRGSQGQATPNSGGTVPATPPVAAPLEMPPPPKFEFAPEESVRFAEDDALAEMKKANKDGRK